MSNNKNDVSSGDVQSALDSIKDMQRTAISKAIPPVWFNGILSLLAGSLVALAAAGQREYHVMIILLMVFIMVYQNQKTGVSVKKQPLKLVVIAAVILIPLFFAFVIAGQYFAVALGVVWAALLAGGLFAAVVLVVSVLERRWYARQIEATNK